MKFNLLLLSITLAGTATAQMADSPAPKLRLVELGASAGVGPSVFNPFGFYSLDAFAPGSAILADSSKWPNNRMGFGNYDSQLNFWGGFTLRAKANPLLRLGFTYSSGQPWSRSAYRETSFTYDTLQSASSPMVVYADSVSITQAGVLLQSNHLQLDASLLWHSKNKGRFGLFAGIGSRFGLSLRATTTVWYSKWDYRHFRVDGEPQNLSRFYQGVSANETESYRNQQQWLGSIYLPMGISMRLGNNGRGNWRESTQLFIQFSPTISTLYAPETGWMTRNLLFSQAGLRLRLS